MADKTSGADATDATGAADLATNWAHPLQPADIYAMEDLEDLEPAEAAVLRELKDAEAAWLVADEAQRVAEAERVKADAALAAAQGAMAAAVAAERGHKRGKLDHNRRGRAEGVWGRREDGRDVHVHPRGVEERVKKRKERLPGDNDGGRRGRNPHGGKRAGEDVAGGGARAWDRDAKGAVGHSEVVKRAKPVSDVAEVEDCSGAEGGARGKRVEPPCRPRRRAVDEGEDPSGKDLSAGAELSAYDSDAERGDLCGQRVDMDTDSGARLDEDADPDAACDALAMAAKADRPSAVAAVDGATDAAADDMADSSNSSLQPATGGPTELRREASAAMSASADRHAAAAPASVRRPRKEQSMLAAWVRGVPSSGGSGAGSTAGSLDKRRDVTRKVRDTSPPLPHQGAVAVAATETATEALVPDPVSSGRHARAARRAAASAPVAAVTAAAASDAGGRTPPSTGTGFRVPKRTLDDVAVAVADEKDEPLVEPTSPLSLLEAAKYILRREGRPMSLQAVVETALTEGIWKSNCKTPKSSLASLLSIQRTKVRTRQIECTFFTQLTRAGDNLVYDPKGLG